VRSGLEEGGREGGTEGGRLTIRVMTRRMGLVSRNILFTVSPSLFMSSSESPAEVEKGEEACAFHCWSNWVWRAGGREGGKE